LSNTWSISSQFRTFQISGVGLIVAGALVLSDVGEFSDFMEGRILAPPVVLIVTGCIVFLVASLGCYGAIRESYYMLMAVRTTPNRKLLLNDLFQFAVCLLIILIIELAVGIAAAVYKNDFQMTMKDLMRSSMKRFENSRTDRDAWNRIQTKVSHLVVNLSVNTHKLQFS
jgi:CD63 antigen